VVDAARLASGDAFHVAMVIGAVLLVMGAVVNLVGITNPASTPERTAVPQP